MKKDMPLEGLRWSRDSGSALYDTPQTAVLGRAGGVKTDNFYQYPCAFCLCYNKQVINNKQEAWR